VQEYIPGQRWISDAELPMGLGTVLSVEGRIITIVFLATGETRTYASQTAPLTRVRFAEGDHIANHDNNVLIVTSVSEADGLITYTGTDHKGETQEWAESELNNYIQLNRPIERLFNGQIDQDKWFELRYQTLQHINNLAHSELYGLTGCRTSLIPHQLYIAHEVANRYAPRVLLADEVGLGKTIEAGLILHHQLITERVKRVLIVVPESLVHQWLVEMLRRFNLMFSIFDEERCLSLEASLTGEETINPFQTEQLVLCHLGFLKEYPERFKQCLDGEWDLMVVDEAHHLEWSEEEVSPDYTIIEKLAAHINGILLLTATPEQLGKESHFARLRLLDPDRFSDFDAFVEEEKHYEPIADAIDELIENRQLSDKCLAVLQSTFEEGDNKEYLQTVQARKIGSADDLTARQILVEHLLDRHGTGRVLLRNTRSSIKGFPQRQVHPHALPLPQEYEDCLLLDGLTADVQSIISPELLYQTSNSGVGDWTDIDPRVQWLSAFLNEKAEHKVLVIVADMRSVLDLANTLKMQYGILAAVFHEDLSLLERDKAAAFFANVEDGSQVLICSEIGSEGRNFQFAHQMVLFDLPVNPDLLEQRIGRLDRIGQTQTIHIHVPYLENSAQQVLFEWYHQGLDAFVHTCPAGHSVYVQLEDELINAMSGFEEDLDALVQSTKKLYDELTQTMHNGRDKLLEYNSCRPDKAYSLNEAACLYDKDNHLEDYMETVFDCLAIDSEIHRDKSLILHPSDHMNASISGLTEDGMTITYDRGTALSNEDVHYFSWEHPFVRTAMDIILSSEQGNTGVTACRYKGAKPGSLLVECVFVLEAAHNDTLQTNRYLPPTTLRIVVDEKAKRHDAALTQEMIKASQIKLDAKTSSQVVQAKKEVMRILVKKCENFVAKQSSIILEAAHAQTKAMLQKEISRLQALAQVNPNVRTEEIRFFELQLGALSHVLESASPRLDAVRAIVVM